MSNGMDARRSCIFSDLDLVNVLIPCNSASKENRAQQRTSQEAEHLLATNSPDEI